MQHNWEVFTTSVYSTDLINYSTNETSCLTLGTEVSYSKTFSKSESNTFWVSQLEDSRSFTSSTSTTQGILSYNTTQFNYSYLSGRTVSTSEVEECAFKGSTYMGPSYTSTSTRSLYHISSTCTGITSIVSISSYGDYSTTFLTFQDKLRIDTNVYSTIFHTSAFNSNNNEMSSMAVSVSETAYLYSSISFTSSTTDIEHHISNAVKSSIIFTKNGVTYSLGNSYYTYSSTSISEIIATRLSGTVYDSTRTNLWTSTSSSEMVEYFPHCSITGYNFITGTDFIVSKGITTSLHASSYTSIVDSTSCSFLSLTAFPQYFTYSIASVTKVYTDEHLSSWLGHVKEDVYLGSFTCSIYSASSASTTELFTFSQSWLGQVSSSSYSYSVDNSYFMYNQESYSFTQYYSSSQSYDWVNASYVTVGFLVNENYTYYYPIYAKNASTYASTFSTAVSISTTGSTTTFFSSTTYTGRFNVSLDLETVFSNYTSNVSTSSTSVRSEWVNNTLSSSWNYGNFTSSSWTTYSMTSSTTPL